MEKRHYKTHCAKFCRVKDQKWTEKEKKIIWKVKTFEKKDGEGKRPLIFVIDRDRADER